MINQNTVTKIMSSTLMKVNKLNEQIAKANYIKNIKALESSDGLNVFKLNIQNKLFRPLTTINLDLPV